MILAGSFLYYYLHTTQTKQPTMTILYIGVAYRNGQTELPLAIKVLVDGNLVADGSFPSRLDLKKPDPVQLKITPGKHTLEAQVAGEEVPFRKTFSLSPGASDLYLNLTYDTADGFLFVSQEDKDFGWR